MKNTEMVFVGFNGSVAALDRRNGDILWRWSAPKGSGYVSLLLDGDSLLAAVNGYTYCLDPRTGQQLWFNPMKGFGYGVTSIATAAGHTPHARLAESEAEQQRAAAASSVSTTAAIT